MSATQVILKENIPGLGAEADIVKVKPGYARNFLVPTGKAYFLTPGTEKTLNHLRAKRAEREATELNESQSFARRIGKLKITLTLETGGQGKAFGSITSNDISKAITEELNDVVIDHHKIVLERPIKNSGDFDIEIKLPQDVTATLKLTVKTSGDTGDSEDNRDSAPARD